MAWLAAGGLRAQEYGLGAVLDRDVYATVPKSAPLARGDYLSTPPAMSFKQYTPPVGNQGEQGSCVGWATAYAARTVMKAKEQGVQDRSAKRKIVLSPSYVFNQINAPGCNGSLIKDALTLMSQQGVALMSDFPYDPRSCSRTPSNGLRAKASTHRIKNFLALWGRSATNKHIPTRRALANGNPVVFGMAVGDSFLDHRGSDNWRPSNTEIGYLRDLDAALDRGDLGGHAMTIVGYDDTRQGGSFEVVNSWGTDWGNNGFAWISYEDYNSFVFEGYEVLPLDPPSPPRVVDMGGQIRVIHISGDEIGARQRDGGYELTRPLPSGTQFRVEASSDENGYLYVIGGDASGDYVLLYPRGGEVSPYAHKTATLLLPGPTEQHFTRLNDTVGTDFYVLLYAQNPIEPDVIAKRMARGSGTVTSRLRSALGSRLVPDDEIDFDANGVGFEAASGEADVAAVVLSIDHIDASPDASDSTEPLIVLTNPRPEAFDSADAPILIPSRFFRLDGMAQDESEIVSLRVEGALSSRYSSRGPFRVEIELPTGPGPHPVTIETQDAAGNSARRIFQFILNLNRAPSSTPHDDTLPEQETLNDP